MKILLLVALLNTSLACSATFIFTGGSGQSINVTLTQDLAIPLTTDSDLHSLGISFILNNVYSQPQMQGYFPYTPYGTPGSIAGSIQEKNGQTLAGTDYALWGPLGYGLGVVDEYDFVGTVQFQYGRTPVAQAGDVLVLTAGTLTLYNFSWFVAPDRPVTTIQLVSGYDGSALSPVYTIDSVTVPEPGAAILGCLGIMLISTECLRRSSERGHRRRS
jgi:hypothetical protein